jgi:hypothetical protein
VTSVSLDVQRLPWTIREDGSRYVRCILSSGVSPLTEFRIEAIPVTEQVLGIGSRVTVCRDAAHEAEWRAWCALYDAQDLRPVTIDGTQFIVMGRQVTRRE